MKDISFERKLVLITGIFVFFTFFASALLMERTTEVTRYGKQYSFDSQLPVGYSSFSSTSSSVPAKLRAEVKGSIYENGSNMTVFGACFDGDSYLLPEANATFTAWYPNGTIVVGPNATMDPILYDFQGYFPNGTGRWKIHVTMGDVIGTYLTEMRCEYDSPGPGTEWAIALGEWQNPEWVRRIGETQSSVSNLSLQLSNFENVTQNNFDNISSQISSIVTGASNVNAESIRELKQSLDALDLNRWVLDETNPFYILGSDAHNFVAVEMLSPDRVAAVSSDGYFVQWDGESWSETYPDAGVLEFRGVSLLPANTVYAQGVGTYNGSPIISINGANSSVYAAPSGSPTALNDIRLFQQPNNPSGYFYTLLLADTGEVYFSNDSQATWGTLGSVDNYSIGRLSQIVDNVDPYNQTDGWAAFAGQGDTVAWTDGVSFNTYSIPGYVVKDVSLIYYDLGWVLAEGASDSRIYGYNGSALVLQYVINDSLVVPTGLAALEQNDVWATTTDPSVLYYYNGRTWEYSTVGFSQLVSVIINFGNASSSFGLRDVNLYDDRHGYAVGGDGLVLVFESESTSQYNNIVSLLNNLTVDLGPLNESIYNTANTTQQLIYALNSSITTLINDVNTSISGDIVNLQVTIDNINVTLNYKLDNVLNNVTYTQLYLENTLFPMVNATYQNTVQILVDLGILSGQVNQTIQLQNDTLTIVNESAQDIDLLVNRSNRIRAWVTQ